MVIEFSLPRQVVRRLRDGFRLRSLGPNALAVAGLLAVVASAPVGAQNSGKGFLFKKPAGSFSFRGGYALANAGSEVFSDAITNLTLNKRDFSSFTWGADISYSTSARTDLVFDGEYMSSNTPSEFRKWVDNNDQPIEQSTKFRRIPLTIGLKYYLADRGRTVSQYAYIPSRYAPYIGVGGGAMYYRFAQDGDFVDFNTDNLEVFGATIEDSGWTPTAHAMAGFDYNLGTWVALSTEGRYHWAKAQLDPKQFEGYDKIDLTGFAATVGFRVRF